jgi:hypothetical protein
MLVSKKKTQFTIKYYIRFFFYSFSNMLCKKTREIDWLLWMLEILLWQKFVRIPFTFESIHLSCCLCSSNTIKQDMANHANVFLVFQWRWKKNLNTYCTFFRTFFFCFNKIFFILAITFRIWCWCWVVILDFEKRSISQRDHLENLKAFICILFWPSYVIKQ